MSKNQKIAAIMAMGLVAAVWFAMQPEEHIVIATWNVRGYPETEEGRRAWFHEKLNEMGPDVLCVQEIANDDRVEEFLAEEAHFATAAFANSSDGQDNAIFAAGWVEVEDIDDPEGFQHPAQAAYVGYRGFDAVIVTVHLSWSDVAMREAEKALLEGVVEEMAGIDPDVIVAGDFNTTEEGIEELAAALGMRVMVPAGQDGVGTTDGNNRYDHFLVTPDLADEEMVSCRIRTYPGDETAWEVSDHLPVLAVFSTAGAYKDRD